MPAETIRIAVEGQDRLSPAVRSARNSLSGLQQSAQRAQGALAGIAKQAAGFGLAMVGVQAAGGIFGAIKDSVIGFNASMEQSKIGWKTMLGSAKAADKMLGDLQKFAATTPFEFPELESASRRLLAMGFAAEDILPLMKDVGNAASALGMSAEGLNRVVLAMGQIRAKTRVQAEEMMQLTEAGIPAWTMLAEAIGKPIPEVMKLAEQGKISADVFISAFRRFSEIKWGGMMDEQSKTFLGSLSTIKDNLRLMTAQAFRPFFDEVSRLALRLSQLSQSSEFARWASQANDAVAMLLRTSGRLMDVMGVVPGQVWLIVAALTALALAANVATLAMGRLGGSFILLGAGALRLGGLLATVARAASLIGPALGSIALVVSKLFPVLAIASLVVTTFALGYQNNWFGMRDVTDRVVSFIVARINDMGRAMRSLPIPGASLLLPGVGVETLHQKRLGALLPGVGTETLHSAAKTSAAIKQVAEAAQDLEKAASVMGGTNALVDNLVRTDPAATEAAKAVDGLREKLAGLEQAQKGAADGGGIQHALKALQEQAGDLSDALSKAKQRLEELTHPSLKGMTAIDDQIFKLEQRAKALQLKVLQAEGRGASDKQLAALRKQEESLSRQTEILRLQRGLKFDVQLREIEKAAAGPIQELTKSEAIAGIKATKKEIVDYEKRLVATNKAVEAQQKAAESLQGASSGLADAIQQVQDQLRKQEDKTRTVIDASRIAYDWFINDTKKLHDMGGEAAKQADIVDAMTRALLSDIHNLAKQESDAATKSIKALVEQYETAKALIAAGLVGTPTSLPYSGNTRTRNIPFSPEGRAAGGSVSSGRPYIVGEHGPELFMPRLSGAIIPSAGGVNLTYAPVIHVTGASGDIRTTIWSILEEHAQLMRAQFRTAVTQGARA